MTKKNNEGLSETNASEATEDIITEKNCFIITPIGAPESEIFKKTTGLLEAVIEPVLKNLGFKALPAHYIASPGSIPKQILRHLVEDELVIANLTGLNPNVMYELAVRHAVKLPLVMMAELGTELPFDVKDQRTILYTDSYLGVEKCRFQLEDAIKEVLSEGYVAENPIYDAIGTNQLLKSVDPISKEEYLVNRLDGMENMISEFIKSNSSYAQTGVNRVYHSDGGITISLTPNKKRSIHDIINEIDSQLVNFRVPVQIATNTFDDTLTLTVPAISKQKGKTIFDIVSNISGISKSSFYYI